MVDYNEMEEHDETDYYEGDDYLDLYGYMELSIQDKFGIVPDKKKLKSNLENMTLRDNIVYSVIFTERQQGFYPYIQKTLEELGFTKLFSFINESSGNRCNLFILDKSANEYLGKRTAKPNKYYYYCWHINCCGAMALNGDAIVSRKKGVDLHLPSYSGFCLVLFLSEKYKKNNPDGYKSLINVGYKEVYSYKYKDTDINILIYYRES